MEIELRERPESPVIIEGFPGFGLVGTITTEFLIDHLNTEKIGTVWFEELPPIVAIHNNSLVDPVGIYHNKEFNIVLFHVVTNAQGLEWKMGEAILRVAEELKAREIVSLEGVGNPELLENAEPKVFFYSSSEEKRKILSGKGIPPLSEGIIVGATSAILLRSKVPVTALFAETHSNIPDSKAAAKAIEELDKYLGLNVDPKPLLETAERFEQKLRDLLSKSQEAQELSEKKRLSYVG